MIRTQNIIIAQKEMREKARKLAATHISYSHSFDGKCEPEFYLASFFLKMLYMTWVNIEIYDDKDFLGGG